MWWQCENGRYINMKHMASLVIEPAGQGKYSVYACEIGEQAKYLIKTLDSREKVEKLVGDIARAEK